MDKRILPQGPEAGLRYGHSEFDIVKPGTFVRCAVTGVPIPLEDLRYWSVELQEPYADAVVATRRHLEVYPLKK